MDAPWGVCAAERPYRERQASLARPFAPSDRRFDLELKWFVGVDWGSQSHQACVLDAAGAVLGEREFKHDGAGLTEMATWLLSFTSGKADEVGVAVETPSGPVVESLLERDFAVHSINPKQLDRFRDRLSPAGAKDDRRDARVLASALRTDPHCLRRLEPTDPAIVELREWSRLGEELTRDRVRLAHRMRQQLWRYYPQFLEAVGDDVAAPWALDLWRSLPTPRAGQRVRSVTLTRVLKQHRIRRIDAPTLRARLRAPAIKLTPGTAEAATTHVRLLVERLALVNRQLQDAERQLDRLVHQLAEAAPADDPDAPATDAADRAARRGDPAFTARRRDPSAGHAAHRGQRRGSAPRLRCTSLPVRGGAGDPAFGEESARHTTASGARPTARRRLPLVARRRPTRSGQPRQVPGAARPRPQSRPRPALGGRPPAQRGLHDAP